MKKINILLIAAAVFTSSLHNTFATEYLNYSEKQAVTKVGNKIITTINNQGGCDTDLYRNVSSKLTGLYMNYSTNRYSKKTEVILTLQNMFTNQWGSCKSTVEEEIIDDLITEVVATKKKGIFKKYIGADIDARQNSSYTYFYYGDILINTVKNEFNNDAGLMYGYDNYGNIDYESDYTFNELKLELYSASYMPYSNSLIQFSKDIDEGVVNYLYNSDTNKWLKLGENFISSVQYYGEGYFIIENEQRGTNLYYIYNNAKYNVYRDDSNIIVNVSVDRLNKKLDITVGPTVERIDIPYSINTLWN